VAAFVRNFPCRVRMTQLKLSNNELQRYIEEEKNLLGPDVETDCLIKVALTLYSKDVEMEMSKKDMKMTLDKKDMQMTLDKKDMQMALNKKMALKDMLLEKNKMEAYLLSKVAFLSQR
jgi:hypothetical protein